MAKDKSSPAKAKINAEIIKQIAKDKVIFPN